MITKQDYVRRVMTVMDEAGMLDSTGMSLTGADAVNPEPMIADSYVDAWRRCAKVLPRLWFKNVSFKAAPHTPDVAHGTGYVELPDDFYLLTKFRMAGWHMDVTDAAIQNERVASIQSNPYARGGTIRPKCVISLMDVNGSLKRALHYYSLYPGMPHTVEEALYVPVPESVVNKPDTFDLEIDDQALELIVYLAGSSVLTRLQKFDFAAALDARVAEMFPGLAKTRGKNVTIEN
jgi:hypothetical protein